MCASKVFIVTALIALFLVGVAIVLYPTINGCVVDSKMEKMAEAFLEEHHSGIEQLESTAMETTPRIYEDLWNAMVSYNEQLWQERQAGLCDPWAYQQPSFSLEAYGMEEVFGVISIPKLDLNMPIYLGASAQHLADGAAQLSQTSLPIGGNHTNCVIAGHRGWRGASYFRYVPELQLGDEVIVTNLWETLRYKVCETKIIAPYEVQEILTQKDRELLTLLTCHPYASGGRQRYVVVCERTEEMTP
jgi:sortase A